MKKGFTLIELLISIIILGALVSLVAQNFASMQLKSRDNKRKSDLRTISVALEAYYNDKGKYPNETVNGELAGCGTGDNQVCTWGSTMTDQYGTTYLNKLPYESRSGMRYYYDVGGGNKTYQLYARLENTKDGSIPVDGQGSPLGYGGTNCQIMATTLCNYGISSTNTTPESGHTAQ